MKISLILADTSRSKEYLKHLIKNNIIPHKVFLYSDKKKHTLEKFIKDNGVKVKFFRSKSINNIKIFNEIKKTVSKYFVYSGYPGEIVKKNLLEAKKIILNCYNKVGCNKKHLIHRYNMNNLNNLNQTNMVWKNIILF